MKEKTLYLIRGLPGSGKSTLANKLSNNKHIETDMYFAMNMTGTYKFDSDKLKEAHEWCRQQCQAMMEAQETSVVVSNTFTQMWEMEPYQRLADQFEYSVFVIHCENDFGNTHNVPPDTIERMAKRWEPYHRLGR